MKREKILGFLSKEKWSLSYLLGLYVFFFIILKICYPEPYYHVDSFGYILCSIKNTIGGYRPFGYSFILRFLYGIMDSPSFITLVQYFMSAFSGISLLLLLKNIFPPPDKWIFLLFSFLFVASPSVLYLTQWMMSDSIFTSLSHFWLFSLIVLLLKKNNYKSFVFFLIFHVLILYFLYFIRHAGLVFSILTSVLFVMRFKKSGMLMLPVCFMIVFLNITMASDMNEKEYGVKTASGFGGWLRANNAMILIPHIDDQPEEFNSPVSVEIHRLSLGYSDATYGFASVMKASIMWQEKSPLHDYLKKVKKQFPEKGYISLRKELDGVYGGYANELIRKHPFLFLKEFVFPNFLRIFYHAGVPEYYSLAYPYSRLHYFGEIESWCKFEKDNKRKGFDLYGKLFNDPYFKLSNLIKWVLFFPLFFLFLYRYKKYGLNKNQRYFFITILFFNVFYLGMLAFVVPIIPRFLVVAHGSQLIGFYIIYSLILYPPKKAIMINV